jgi:hypothetical protein
MKFLSIYFFKFSINWPVAVIYVLSIGSDLKKKLFSIIISCLLCFIMSYFVYGGVTRLRYWQWSVFIIWWWGWNQFGSSGWLLYCTQCLTWKNVSIVCMEWMHNDCC